MKFSILVPAYKPQFLAECIESILTQTYPDWELIIINDASPYDIDIIVDKYSDSRIRYYKREKGFGVERLVDNWNDCLSNATGEFVINMGDDDKLLPNCLADYYELISKYPNLDIYHMRTEIINENSDVIDIQEDRPDVESVYSMIWYFWKGRRQWIGDWLFRTTTLRHNGGFYYLPCAWGSDNISAFIAAKETGVANCSKLGFSYRVSTLTVSKSKQVSPLKVLAWNKADEWYRDFLQNEPGNEKDKGFWSFLSNNRKAYINHVKREEIIQHITIDFCNLFFWMRKRKYYQVTWKLLYSSVIQYVKNGVLNYVNN